MLSFGIRDLINPSAILYLPIVPLESSSWLDLSTLSFTCSLILDALHHSTGLSHNILIPFCMTKPTDLYYMLIRFGSLSNNQCNVLNLHHLYGTSNLGQFI
ncbi:hypothetical protein NPIL_620971 [Nephila pilipes]|uniref:Uncharacterized protein n=1 Tax=Nephila pilipes TaxID=299642 RepID=A0A8X6QB21_NEPPI|nr:hypothetical protein NPIL_620971 [Nephila pilipes]